MNRVEVKLFGEPGWRTVWAIDCWGPSPRDDEGWGKKLQRKDFHMHWSLTRRIEKVRRPNRGAIFLRRLSPKGKLFRIVRGKALKEDPPWMI
jgi:hypothetical protein